MHAAALPDQAPSRSLSWALSECETLDEGTLARIVEKVKKALQIAQLESKKKQAGKRESWPRNKSGIFETLFVIIGV